ncbi:hypothetical protein W911_17415 [Hyphomicrobium nitrativorans NL23]|uniref:Uncharacterized protein n=1 Tax=Hyphomicrobium nitrativorans NL23 TaxID=1029756 RepID=V5SHX7_9HYPH|nr:hypothetical protein [Hyphomicrobium nitrativorans]AHB50466.1 hypothetical protein W911_17415 [Hyphomicrobium nitrativorans NL23]
MREEIRLKFDRQLRIARLKKAALGIAAASFVAGGLWISGLDASIETHRVAGVVEAVGPLVGGSSVATEHGIAVDVLLHDGRHVHVTASKATDPHIGDVVNIAEHVHGTGRVTYSWR